VIKEARARALTIESQAQSRANQIIEEARKAAGLEGEKALAAAQAQITLESNRARDALRGQVVSLAVAGAKRVLEKEIDQKTHGELLDQLAAKL
jgi:F-type H+-transporting ATPase subunit b